MSTVLRASRRDGVRRGMNTPKIGMKNVENTKPESIPLTEITRGKIGEAQNDLPMAKANIIPG